MSPKNVDSRIILAVVFIIVLALSYLYFSGPEPEAVIVYGIKVVADKPLEEYVSIFESRGVALMQTPIKGGLTCNFELSASFMQSEKGYRVNMEEGEKGIYLYNNQGYVKGFSEKDFVSACNALVCLIKNITCPNDISVLSGLYTNVDEVNLVLDSNSGSNVGRAYAELLGVLGYVQAERADVNKDGTVSNFELNNLTGNFIAIRPYLMNNDTCVPQQLHNLVETFEPNENDTVACSSLGNTIFVVNSSVNEIKLMDSNIYLIGDEDHGYIEATLLRDAMSPKWIRVLYQVESL